MSIENKVYVVTGAARGIGKNISLKLASIDSIICIADINEEDGRSVVADINALGFSADFFLVDLSCNGAANQLVSEVVNKYKKIDAIINNARGRQFLNCEKETEESWDFVFNVGLRSAYFLAIAAIPFMNSKSSIINIGSTSGRLISNESPAYQISKGAVGQLTRYLANYAGPLGIRVNEISPGFIVQDEHFDRYDRNDAEQTLYREAVNHLHPLKGGPGRSDDIAHAVKFLVSDEASFITGNTLVVDGGLSTQDPTKVLFDYKTLKALR